MEGKKPAEQRAGWTRRNTTETLLWLLVIVGLLVLVLQATGYVHWFQMQGVAAVIALSVTGVALAAGAFYSYWQGMRMRQTIKQLTEQQRRRIRAVTLSTEDEGSEAEQPTEEEEQWTEKVKFSAIIEERQRLARELHDAVSQQLFAISMTATAVGRTMDKDFERARRQVALIEEMASAAQSEMRALLLHLRPIHLDGKNLAQALHNLLEELKQKVPMAIGLDLDPTIAIMPHVEDHLFRIAQEALSNTLRHAKATAMDIRLFRFNNQIRLIMRDNGVGFDPEDRKQSSYGLLTMEERVSELGGTLQVHTAPGEGTTIDIAIPVLMDERGSE